MSLINDGAKFFKERFDELAKGNSLRVCEFLAFQPHWYYGDRYTGLLNSNDLSHYDSGDQAVVIDPKGRKMILTMTPVGLVIVFQRKHPGDGQTSNEIGHNESAKLRPLYDCLFDDHLLGVERLKYIIGMSSPHEIPNIGETLDKSKFRQVEEYSDE